MRDFERTLFRSLVRKCRVFDQNPSLKNICLSTPTHLMSLRGQSVEQITSTKDVSITERFIRSMNNGAEYHLPHSSSSMMSILRSTIAQQRSQQSSEIQSTFDGIRLLNNAQQFLPHLGSHFHSNPMSIDSIHSESKLSNDLKLNMMDHLDRDLLLNGNMAFIQHPMAMDFDRSDPKKKHFETRKVMIGLKLNVKGCEDMTFLQIMNKPMDQILHSFMDRANRPIHDSFAMNKVYYGGISQTKINSVTTNPNCEGIPCINGTLFFNPNRDRALEVLVKGDAKTDDFRFFVGFECLRDVHLENIMSRNKYIAVDLSNPEDAQQISEILWSDQRGTDAKYRGNDMWTQMVSCLSHEIAESWLRIPESVLDSEAFINLNEQHKENITAQLATSKKS